MPQVIITLVCGVISTNANVQATDNKLSTYIHLLYSGNTLYIKPDVITVTLHCGLEWQRLWIKGLFAN